MTPLSDDFAGLPTERAPERTRLAARLDGTLRRPIGFRRHAEPPAEDPWIYLADEAHVLTVAPTGAGKTLSCTAPALLQHAGPAIVLDPKGENAAITARRRREIGQRTIVLDPIGLVVDETDSLNPLDLIDPTSADAPDEARALAEVMLPAEFDARDVFWRSRAMHLLTAAIIYVVTDLAPERRTLMSVRDTVHRMARDAQRGETPGKGSFAQWSSSPDVRRLHDLFDLGSIETVGGMIHTALEGVGFVSGQGVERSLRKSSFALDDVTEGGPLTIYIVLPPHMMSSHGRLLRIWLATLFGALMRRRRRPKLSTLLLLDEAAQLGAFQPLKVATTLLRGYGIQTWSLWQDPSQLVQLYPRDWKTIVNNCRVVQCFGASSRAARSDMGDLIGANLADWRDLGPATMALRDGGEPELARRIDYRFDPLLAPHADDNPVHDVRPGPARRPLRPSSQIGRNVGESGDDIAVQVERMQLALSAG